MEFPLPGARVAALSAVAWASACGGNVVVDGMPDGAGGAGATSSSVVGATSSSVVGGTSASAGAVGTGGASAGAAGAGGTSTSGSWTTSAVTSSSTGVGGGDPWSMCVRYCEHLRESCAVPVDDCSGACDEQLGMAPDCNDLLVSFFESAMRGACPARAMRAPRGGCSA